MLTFYTGHSQNVQSFNTLSICQPVYEPLKLLSGISYAIFDKPVIHTILWRVFYVFEFLFGSCGGGIPLIAYIMLSIELLHYKCRFIYHLKPVPSQSNNITICLGDLHIICHVFDNEIWGKRAQLGLINYFNITIMLHYYIILPNSTSN